jgi:hypothetical protein
MLRKASQRRLCLRFWRGDTYWYVNNKGVLVSQNTVTNPDGSGKPPHRIRNKYNFIKPIVQGKVSAANQKIPSYQTLPTNTDPDVEFAAQLAKKVALYGYDQWNVKKAMTKAIEFALVCDGGFVMPYFDPNVGPYTPIHNPDTGAVEMVGQGEIKFLVLGGNEVYWRITRGSWVAVSTRTRALAMCLLTVRIRTTWRSSPRTMSVPRAATRKAAASTSLTTGKSGRRTTTR